MVRQELITGGLLTVDEQAIVCRFPAERFVLSTSLYNGGYLIAEAVFNQRLNLFVNCEQDLPGGSMGKYLAHKAEEYGLNIGSSTGLLTSARMDCRGYSFSEFEGIVVEVVATAGVEQNGARAGDPASYIEDSGQYRPIGGTINLLVFTNVSMPQGTMAKALLSITEAKTAALQELAVVSPFTNHWATGTGTDGIILVCDHKARTACTDTGTQSKLGEMLCQTVKTAIKAALFKECHIDPKRQGSIAERIRSLNLELGSTLDIEKDEAHVKLLLAMSRTVWQEYIWGLVDLEEVKLFLVLLEKIELQPWGKSIATALNKKLASCQEV